MRQRAGSTSGIVDTTRSMMIVDPNAFPVNLGHTATEDLPEGSFKLIAYDGANVLPTPMGYKSFFSDHNLFDSTALPSQYCQHVLIFQTPTFTNLIVALCEEGIYWCSATTDQSTPWILVGATGHNDAGTTKVRYLWTWAMVANKLCLYCQGQPAYYVFTDIASARNMISTASLIEGATVAGVYESTALSFGINQVIPSFLNMQGQMGLFRAGSRLGFWDSDNSVSWSSATYLQDFTPSTTTFAGATKFADVTGNITKVLGQGSGFMIYSSRSIVRCTPLGNSPEKWTGAAVMSDTGVVFDTQVCAAQPDEIHYAITSAGLMRFTAGSPEPIETEVSDYVQENSDVYSVSLRDGRYLFLHSSDDLVPSQSFVEVIQVVDADNNSYNFPPTVDGGEGQPVQYLLFQSFEDDNWRTPPQWIFSQNPANWIRTKSAVTEGEWNVSTPPEGTQGSAGFSYAIGSMLDPQYLNTLMRVQIDWRASLIAGDIVFTSTDGVDQTIIANGPGVFTGTAIIDSIPSSSGSGPMIMMTGPGGPQGLSQLHVDNYRLNPAPVAPEPIPRFTLDFEDDVAWRQGFTQNPNNWEIGNKFVTKGTSCLQTKATGIDGSPGVMWVNGGPLNMTDAEKAKTWRVRFDYRAQMNDFTGDGVVDLRTGSVMFNGPGIHAGTYEADFVPNSGQFPGMLMFGGGWQSGANSLAIDNYRLFDEFGPTEPVEPPGGNTESPELQRTDYLEAQVNGKLDTAQELFKSDFVPTGSPDAVDADPNYVAAQTVPAGRTMLPCYSGRGFSSDWDDGKLQRQVQLEVIRDIKSPYITDVVYPLRPMKYLFKTAFTTSELGPTISGPTENLYYDKAGDEFVAELQDNLTRFNGFIDSLYVLPIASPHMEGKPDQDSYNKVTAAIVPTNSMPPDDWELMGEEHPWPEEAYDRPRYSYEKSIGQLPIAGTTLTKVNKCSLQIQMSFMDYSMKAVPNLSERVLIKPLFKLFGYYDDGSLGYYMPMSEPSQLRAMAIDFSNITEEMKLEYAAWKAAGCEGQEYKLALLGFETSADLTDFQAEAVRTGYVGFGILGNGYNWAAVGPWSTWNRSRVIMTDPRSDVHDGIEVDWGWPDNIAIPQKLKDAAYDFRTLDVSPGFMLARYPQRVAMTGMTVATFKNRLWSAPTNLTDQLEVIPGITNTSLVARRTMLIRDIFCPQAPIWSGDGAQRPRLIPIGGMSFAGGKDTVDNWAAEIPSRWGTGWGANYWNTVGRRNLFLALATTAGLARGSAFELINTWEIEVVPSDGATASVRTLFTAEISGFGYIPNGGFSFRKTHSRALGTACGIPSGDLIADEEIPPGQTDWGQNQFTPFTPQPYIGNRPTINPGPVASWPYPDPVPIPDMYALFKSGTPAPFYPLYKSAVFLDLLYKKWGRYARNHRVQYDLMPVNRVDAGVVPQRDYGIRAGALREDGRLTYFTSDVNDAKITYGRLGFYRLGVTTLTALVLRFAENANCTVILEVSYDGETIQSEYTIATTITERTQVTIPFTVKGKWFNIKLQGKFNLIGLSYEGEARGRR